MRAFSAFALLAAALAAAPAAFAATDPSAGTGGAAFMKLGIGAPRAQALGNAYVALAEGQEAMLWNPAGLARAHSREITGTVLSWVQGMQGEYLGYVHPLGRSVLGLSFAYMSISGFDVRNDQGLSVENDHVVVRDGFASASFARSFFVEKLFVGATLKGVYEDNAAAPRSTLVGDVGLLFRPNASLQLGAAAQNLLGSPSAVVQTSRLGAAYRPNEFLTFTVESSKDSDNASRVGAGVELNFPQEILQVGEFALRAGYFGRDSLGQGYENGLKPFGLDLSKVSGLSFGAGLYTTYLMGYGIGLDYAYLPFGSLGVVNQLGVKVSF